MAATVESIPGGYSTGEACRLGPRTDLVEALTVDRANDFIVHLIDLLIKVLTEAD